MPKFVSRSPVLEDYMYTADGNFRSCIYTSQVGFVSRSCIYALDIVLITSIGSISNNCIYALDVSFISDLCNTSIL